MTAKTEIAVKEAALPAVSADMAGIANLLTLAVEKGVDVNVLEKLVDLHERVSDRQAANEFNQALAAFQSECPPIEKKSVAKIATSGGGGYAYRYAELDQIARVTRPLLTKHGLSYTWDSSMDGARVVCTCTLRHVGGHQTKATFTSPTDSASAMSSQQKHASALTYARRQSLIQVLGLTTTEPDTDGASDRKITEQQAMFLLDRLNDLPGDTKVHTAAFLKYMRVERVADIQERNFDMAKSALAKKAAQGGAQ